MTRLPAQLRRSLGAAQAKAAGDDFEGELDAMHAAWAKQGIARFQRGNVRTIRVHGELIPVGKSGVDFVGVYRGLAVAFDAKSRSGAAGFELKGRRGSEHHECEFLRDFGRAGGIAFILVRDPALSRVYLIPYGRLEALLAGDRIRLREDRRRDGERPAALLPCLDQADTNTVLAIARGGHRWPWQQLLAPQSSPLSGVRP